MRNVALGLAAGAMALVMSAEAGACSRMFPNRAEHPFISNIVSEAASIEIARLVSVSEIPEEDWRPSLQVETHIYLFDTVEFLRGAAHRQFQFRAGPPLDAEVPSGCLEDGELVVPVTNDVCIGSAATYLGKAQTEQLANSGHADWSGFFHFAEFQDGMLANIPDNYLAASSCLTSIGLLPDMTYLVFRDDAGRPINGRGLNFRPVIHEDDEWRRAVEYFAENPTETRLPPLRPENILDRYNGAAVVSYRLCPNARPPYFDSHHPSSEIGQVETLLRGQSDDWVPTNYLDFARANIWLGLDDCGEDNRFLFLNGWIQTPERPRGMPSIALPIENGMVDLSGIPSQFAIEPSEVPLEDVLSWLSHSEDTNQ